MSKKMNGYILFSVAILGLAATVVAAQAEPGEDPKDIIAVQIRKQGFTCVNPESATQDKEQSRPDEPVWLLKCEGASYRVRMMPDQAAKVEKLD
ncbi:MAG: hypothetical protein MUC37_10470 [Hyphomicrobium sp.]|nr:hypothetical protein [Hyphomicrobium sp.]